MVPHPRARLRYDRRRVIIADGRGCHSPTWTADSSTLRHAGLKVRFGVHVDVHNDRQEGGGAGLMRSIRRLRCNGVVVIVFVSAPLRGRGSPTGAIR